MAGDTIGGSSQVALVTGGYDHTIKLWQAHSGVCLRTMQHPESVISTLIHSTSLLFYINFKVH